MFSRVLQDRRGATALEFGLIGLIFIFLLFGIVELGRYYFMLQSARTFTQDVARGALVIANNRLVANGNDTCTGIVTGGNVTPSPTTSPTLASLYAKAPFLRSGCTLTPVPTVVCSPNRRITVTTSCPFTFLVPLPFLPTGSQTITSRVIIDIP